MVFSNAICIIVTMVSTYWATHRQHPQSSKMVMKDTPLSRPLTTNINLSIDVKMNIEEEKHKVHNLLFSVPAHVLYDAVLTVLTPMQAVKLQNDIRKATDSVTQKIFDVKAEPSNESRIIKEEEKDATLSTALYQSRSMTENKASNEILERFKKGSLAVSKTRGESLTISLHTSPSPSTIPDDQILAKLGARKTKKKSASQKKRYFKHEQHSVTSASSAIRTKSKTLISTFEEPLQSRRLSLPELKKMSEPSQPQTGLCQVLGIEIKTDRNGSGTTWVLSRALSQVLKNDETDEVILSGGPYEDNKAIVNNYESCLNPGLYKFIIDYSNDDDVWDNGYYMLTLNDVLLHIGGQYGGRRIIPIKVTLPSKSISIKPSVSYKPVAMPQPTVTPSVTSYPTIQHSNDLETLTTSLPTQYCTGEGKVRGQVRISAIDKPVKLVWDVYESQSDVVLFEGSLGSRDICVTEHGCYTFRIHDGVQEAPFNFTLTLGGMVQLQEDALDTKYAGRFGFRSCCKTTCCPTNQAMMEMVVHTDRPTEDLEWKLYQSKEKSMNKETLVIKGGQYDGNHAYYITETCINPKICHALEILGENKTTSYKSIGIKVDSETKLREYNVQAGSSLEFCSVCNTEPLLVTNFESNYISDRDGKAFNARTGAIMQILSQVSSQEELLNTKTAQYKAACWIIYDDLQQVQSSDPTLVQRYTLAVLYYATGGEHWSLPKYELKYLSRDNECNWNDFDEDYSYDFGIECAEGGQIKSVDLSQMNLKGKLPSEISSLRSLEGIYFGGNSLEGNIPIEIGKLKALIELEIWGNSLTGSIPESIFDLSELRALNLGTNSLTGTLSTLVGKLYKLEFLYLEKQSLTGSIPDQLFEIRSLTDVWITDNAFNSTIPSSIGQASKLRYIHASNNMLTGMIPSTIGELQNLQSLHFSLNSLTGPIPSQIGQSKNLKSIWLHNNQLKGTIPEEITLLNNITLLFLENNLLQGAIPQNIGNMENLKQLSLNGNKLNGTIPSNLSKLPELAELSLQSNDLEGTMPKEICGLRNVNLALLGADCAYEYTPPKVECECCSHCMGQFTDLEHEGICHDSELRIEMSYKDNNWVSKYWSVTNGANQTILSESHGRDLETPSKSSYRACISRTDCFMLLIDGYPFYYEVYPFLNFSIYVNDTKIYNNDDNEYQIWYGTIKFGYSGALGTSVLDQCDDVQYHGKFYASGSKERLIINEILTISGYSVALDESSAESQAAKWIVSGDKHVYDATDKFRIVQRYVLAVLYYSTNGKNWLNNTNFISDNNECDWAGVTCDNQNVLEGLDLHQNNVIGTIPHETGQLSMLKHLNLSDNKGLSGTLPTEIQNLWSIETLDISNCTISGSIPDKIWHWDNLHSLNLCCNRITGSLSKDTRKARKIEFLHLHDNLISGNLPKFSYETKLRDLDLSSNYIEGNLMDVGSGMKLDYLVKLKLSRNFLAGTIPSEISAAIGLKELDLSSNGFTGYIPSGLGKMKELKALMLNGNKLRGTIPPEIFRIRGLTKVMLQSNELTGTISSQIGGLKGVEQISLSYNSLKGTLPEEIKDIRESLAVLHIHSNKLMGETSWMKNCNEWSDERNFVADCGKPTASNDPLGCKCCTICCNSDGYCRSNEVPKFSPIQGVFIACAVIYAFLIICAVITKYMKKYDKLPFIKISLVKTIKDDSVYCFLLTNDKTCLCLAFFIIMCQFLMFFSFLIAASYKNDGYLVAHEFQSNIDETTYSMRCYPNSLECTDQKYITIYGWALFTLLMALFMSRDLVISIKLLYSAAMSRSYRLFLGGATILIMTTVAISASVFYNKEIAETDPQLVLNALLLTVFSNVDEEAMSLLKAMNRSWVEKKLNVASRFSRYVMRSYDPSDLDESIEDFETNQIEAVEEVPRCECSILNLFVGMFHKFVDNLGK